MPGRLGLFVLDFDEIHAGLAEEFQVLVDGRLALVVGGVEVHEEGGRNGFRTGPGCGPG